MLRLESLEMEGFKSFADKTKLSFPDGVTCVVGPNGCGKSNIADAIAWVLGEQSAKNLRGNRMEDVIFAGTSTRKASGSAEVHMTWRKLEALSSDEDSKLVVTRKLLRSGDSGYLMNGKNSRLKDIQAALLDFGMGTKAYSIIEQGKVGMILSSKPSERRQLIEEAAGILKYKLRRHETRLKLKAAEENLTRINDIVQEVQKQRAHLNRQVGKARRYKQLKTEFRDMELGQLQYELHHNYHHLKEVTRSYDKVAKEEAAINADIGRLDADIAARKQQLLIDEQRLRMLEKQFHDCIRQIDLSEQNITFHKEKVAERGAQIESWQQERVSVTQERERVQNTLTTRDEELAKNAEALALRAAQLAEIEAAAVALQEEAETALAKAAQARDAFQRDTSKLHGLDVEARQIAGQLQTVDEQHQHFQDLEITLLQDLEDRQAELETGNESLELLKEQHEQQREQQETTAAQLADLKSQRAQQETQLRDLEREGRRLEDRRQNLEDILSGQDGVSDTTKSLLKKTAGRFQLLRDCLDSTHTYDAPLEILLDPLMEAPIVRTQADYQALQPFLGQQTLRYLDLRQAPQPGAPVETPQGLVAALDLVVAEPEIRAALSLFLAGKYVVTDVQAFENTVSQHPHLYLISADATQWAQGSFRMVFGKKRKSGGFLKMKGDIAHITSQLEQTSAQLDAVRPQFEQTRNAVAHHSQRLELLQQNLRETEKKVAMAEQQMAHQQHLKQQTAARLEQERQKAQQLKARESQLRERLEQVQENAEQLRATLEERREHVNQLQESVNSVQAKRHDMQGELGQARQREISAAELQKRLENEHKQLREMLTGLAARMERGETQQATWQKDISGYQQTIRDLHIEIKNLLGQRDIKQAAFKKQETILTELRAALGELEEKQQVQRSERDDIRAAQGRFELERARLESNLERLKESYFENQGESCEIAQIDPMALPTEAEFERNRETLKELKRKINDLGTVNLLAIEEFEEIDERYNFLLEQQKDLIGSITEIQATIDRLNKISAEKFGEAFEVINTKFNIIFNELFGGGQAHMELIDPDDILESGIDLIIQPPGKKVGNAMLMSGGEKALTAISLLFAIFEYKPSPFCLLDEVDAPLDEANVKRLAGKLTQMKARTQFIVITHHKATMSIATTLFGVTMEEAGCSKIVSVKFA